MSFRWSARALDQIVADQDETLRLLTAPAVPDLAVDPWQGYDFDPVWSADTASPAIADGEIEGRIVLLGRTMVLRIGLLIGSSTTLGTGDWYFALPFAHIARVYSGVDLTIGGRAMVAGNRLLASGEIRPSAPTRVYPRCQTASSTVLGAVNATTPAAWGAGYTLELYGVIPLV